MIDEISHSRAYQGQTVNLLSVITRKAVDVLLPLSPYFLADGY